MLANITEQRMAEQMAILEKFYGHYDTQQWHAVIEMEGQVICQVCDLDAGLSTCLAPPCGVCPGIASRAVWLAAGARSRSGDARRPHGCARGGRNLRYGETCLLKVPGRRRSCSDRRAPAASRLPGRRIRVARAARQGRQDA